MMIRTKIIMNEPEEVGIGIGTSYVGRQVRVEKGREEKLCRMNAAGRGN
jgi:hypothetical protein